MGRGVVMLAMKIMRNAYVVPNRFLIMISLSFTYYSHSRTLQVSDHHDSHLNITSHKVVIIFYYHSLNHVPIMAWSNSAHRPFHALDNRLQPRCLSTVVWPTVRSVGWCKNLPNYIHNIVMLSWVRSRYLCYSRLFLFKRL